MFAASIAAWRAAEVLFGPRSAWPVTMYVSAPVATTPLALEQAVKIAVEQMEIMRRLDKILLKLVDG